MWEEILILGKILKEASRVRIWNRLTTFIIVVLLLFAVMGATIGPILKGMTLGLDLQGGFEILYKIEPLQGEAVTPDLLNQTQTVLQNRINFLGVSEPVILTEPPDRLRIQLPGVTSAEEARKMLATQARLTFRNTQGQVLLTGADLKEGSAQVGFSDKTNAPVVTLTFKDPQKFAEITKQYLGQPIGIYLDENLIQAPTVQAVITNGKAEISGQKDVKEAKQLAALLNAGALPVNLKELSFTSVSATLGQLALKHGIEAGILALIFIVIFMLVVYRLPGLVAVITLTVYAYLVFFFLWGLQATLTLPGIAALILGLGMAVDANIITDERIKDEIRSGKSIASALRTGGRKSFLTIIDSHVTTFIAGAVLFVFGTSAIRGFAVILMLSTVLNLLTNVGLARILLSMLVGSGRFNKLSFFGVKDHKGQAGTFEPFYYRFDFVKKRRLFFLISLVLLVVGVGSYLVHGLNLGVDFTSGTRVEALVGHSFTDQEVRTALAKANLEPSVIERTGSGDTTSVVMRYKGTLTQDEEKAIAEALKAHFQKDVTLTVSTISPEVGRELAKKAIYSLLIASLGIVLYMALRFEYRMAVTAIVSILNVVITVIGLIAFLNVEVDITFITALLTIVGYSINDTVIIFDRIRENLKSARLKRIEDVEALVNKSIRQVFVRSVNTVATVLFAALALLIFGGQGLFLFALTLTIGLFLGAYSSIFTAAQLWVEWKEGEIRSGRLKTEPTA